MRQIRSKTGQKSQAGFFALIRYSSRETRMNVAPESLGLIAGNRSLPLEFARQARAAGVKRLSPPPSENETEPALAKLVDDIVWLKVGQLGKMISAFTDRKFRNASWSARLRRKIFSICGQICARWECCSA